MGANGSGKSNFFHAIRFVIGDVFSSLRAEDRARLLHEGAGHAVSQAYVEVVFDNSDNRFPVDRSEVRLRRTIGLKRDEYSVDRRAVTKAEVQSLLESAGFSRANPYYVVQQGKITAMSTMRDDQRLELLKEIGGTKVYEERRRESLRILAETEGRRALVSEMLQGLDARLAELEAEREELAAFQQADRARRSLEYTIFDADVAATRARLEGLERRRAERGAALGAAHEALREAAASARRADKQARALAAEATEHERARGVAASEKAAALERATTAELDVAELEQRAASAAADGTSLRGALEALAQETAALEKELADAKLEAEAAAAREAAAGGAAAEASRRLEALYAKRGRRAQFSSAAERDSWVRAELKGLAATRARATKAAEDLEAAAAAATAGADASAGEAARSEAAVAEAAAASDVALEAEEAALAKRDAAQAERKELWREGAAADKKAADARAAVARADKGVEAAVARDVHRGLQSVRRIAAEHNFSGVRGPLIELVSCLPQLHTAVEVAAGAALFHVVVDDDEVATSVVRRLAAERGGRATFIPLNRVATRAPAQVPSSYGTDAVPLMRYLKYDAAIEAAVAHVFGRVVVCKDLDVAAAVARETGLSAVTVAGDSVGRKGALTGGFIEESRSKMGAMLALGEARGLAAGLEREAATLAARAAEVDQAVAAAVGEQQRAAAERAHARSLLAAARADAASARARAQDAAARVEPARAAAAEAAAGAREAGAQDAALRAELGTPLVQSLSAAEAHEAEERAPPAAELPSQATEAKLAAASAGAKVEAISDALHSDLHRRRDELASRLAAAGGLGGSGGLAGGSADADAAAAAAARLVAARRAAAEARAALAEAERAERAAADAASKAAEGAAAAAAELEALREAEEAASAAAADGSRGLDTALAKRGALLSRKADLERKIRDLGSLPSDAFERYRGRPAAELHAALHKAQQVLKKLGGTRERFLFFLRLRGRGRFFCFSLSTKKKTRKKTHNVFLLPMKKNLPNSKPGVNQKALDQHANLSEQRESLQRRAAENAAAEDKIRQLVRTLDLRKDEALERTFKGVARNFREVFAELVPGGRGELVMQRAASSGGGGGGGVGGAGDDEMPDAEAVDNGDDAAAAAANGGEGPSNAAAAPPRDKYQGVRVKVSFGGGRETTTISSLSGGQKTLVALALIFAIQRCDPAPFYLCDEVDAALDPAYRSAVAALVAKTARAGTSSTQDDEEGGGSVDGGGQLSPPAQFIVTTFHPQLVSVADRVYGVSHANRVSRIALVSKGDALQFVQTEEARAQKASAAAAAAAAAAGGKGGKGGGGGGGGATVAVDA